MQNQITFLEHWKIFRKLTSLLESQFGHSCLCPVLGSWKLCSDCTNSHSPPPLWEAPLSRYMLQRRWIIRLSPQSLRTLELMAIQYSGTSMFNLELIYGIPFHNTWQYGVLFISWELKLVGKVWQPQYSGAKSNYVLKSKNQMLPLFYRHGWKQQRDDIGDLGPFHTGHL